MSKQTHKKEDKEEQEKKKKKKQKINNSLPPQRQQNKEAKFIERKNKVISMVYCARYMRVCSSEPP